MINMVNVATTATFMVTGFLNYGSTYVQAGYGDTLEKWGQGCVELHMEIAAYAETSEELLEAVFRYRTWDFPGVYDYEVSEPFGSYLRNYLEMIGEMPPRDRANAKLIDLICDFFAQGFDKEEAERNKLELNAVLTKELANAKR